MDIDEVRRTNIRTLEHEFGSPSALADAVGMSYAQYQNLRDGANDPRSGKKRGMRKETAWRFEDAGKRPRGWLDQPHIDGNAPGATLTSSIDGGGATASTLSFEQILAALNARLASVDAGTRETIANLTHEAICKPDKAQANIAAIEALMRFATGKIETAAMKVSATMPQP